MPPSLPDLQAAVLFLGPGFLALKLFYLFGVQRVRSEWEWAVWSVLASIPLDRAAIFLAEPIALRTPWSPDAITDALRFGLAAIAGLVGSLAWRELRLSSNHWASRLRTAVTDSAWDKTLEDADLSGRPVELVTDDDRYYRGWIRYAGREDTRAQGWIYLIFPRIREQERAWDRPTFRAVTGTHGLLFHRDRLKRIRIYKGQNDLASVGPAAIPTRLGFLHIPDLRDTHGSLLPWFVTTLIGVLLAEAVFALFVDLRYLKQPDGPYPAFDLLVAVARVAFAAVAASSVIVALGLRWEDRPASRSLGRLAVAASFLTAAAAVLPAFVPLGPEVPSELTVAAGSVAAGLVEMVAVTLVFARRSGDIIGP